MQRNLFALALLLVGCDGATKGQTTANTTTGTTPSSTTVVACDAVVGSVDPVDTSVASVDTVVTVDFSQAIGPGDAFDVALTDPGGGSVAGTLELGTDGLSGTFTPDADLAFDTVYDVTSSVCDDALDTSFSTPETAVDPLALAGRSYALNVAQVVWIEPQNSTLVEGLLTVDYILVQVRNADLSTDTLTAVAGTGAVSANTIVPDCPAASDTPPADFSGNPNFLIGPTLFSVASGDTLITLEDFELSGGFRGDLMAIEDVHFAGLIDPGVLEPGLGCGLVAALVSGTCVPCPSGVGECLVIEGTAVEAPYRDDVDMITDCGL
ncbi:MAG: hypothetical protein GWP91_10305 [Rhodobacterales bacterium]|nr:hypothetical protein [Rhodobacterales bacterium]